MMTSALVNGKLVREVVVDKDIAQTRLRRLEIKYNASQADKEIIRSVLHDILTNDYFSLVAAWIIIELASNIRIKGARLYGDTKSTLGEAALSGIAAARTGLIKDILGALKGIIP